MTNHAFYGILKPSKERRFDVMYEYEVLLKNGERTFIWGRDYDDALCRHPETAKEIEAVLFQEYID
nr:MAG TPA: hypothetical protein [Caudoviricetes sp.]